LDRLPRREPEPALAAHVTADLCIVGGGFTGLWAALHAKREDAERDVVLVEAQTVGFGGSGRNGGFVASSLTHGVSNGLARFPEEMELLERLGAENFVGLRADLERLGIDCDWEENGSMTLAVEPHQIEWMKEEAAQMRRFGEEATVLDRSGVRAEVDSPLYLGGVWGHSGALIDPAKLVEGLRAAAAAAGVRIFEGTPAVALRGGTRMRVSTPIGSVTADRVLLATNAFKALLRSARKYIVPVYDYVLVTEPLSASQRDAIGWRNRQGLSDGGNQFHYYRLTSDDRILYGGYDAVYRFGGRVSPSYDTYQPTFERLAQHFFTTFPSLSGIRFSHAWGGAIDTCSRFSPFFGMAHDGRVAYALGYTGLGVGATRFGAQVALDLLDSRDTVATRTRFVRTKPVPFPPEPLRTLVIQATRNRLAAADLDEGKRGLWLRALDRFGLGFDS